MVYNNNSIFKTKSQADILPIKNPTQLLACVGRPHKVRITSFRSLPVGMGSGTPRVLGPDPANRQIVGLGVITDSESVGFRSVAQSLSWPAALSKR
jgi:hypothetical protein